MKTTLAQAKLASSGIPRIAGYCTSDSRYSDLVNEAVQRLLTKGIWWGTFQRYTCCTNSGCLVWPRQFATIEQVAVCNQPVRIRNNWFEFMENGIGLRDGNCNSENGNCRSACDGMQLFDRGNVCAFADIIGTNKKIKVYADVAEDAGAKILLQGYDENNNWIRTEVDGEWVDGEYVTISTTPQTSTKFFRSLTGVQKPLTNGFVRLYEYDTDELTQRAIAIYEWDELIPWYRRSFINGLPTTCCGSDEDCEDVKVTVQAKMEFFPARKDTDYLLIGNIPAIKLSIMALKKEEANLLGEAEGYWMSAERELQKELEHYRGHGNIQPIQINSKPFNASVANII